MLRLHSDTRLPAGSLPPDPSPPPRSSPSGSTFPRAARALERGALDEVRTLLTQADRQQTETRLLRARLLVRQGEVVSALRELEEARRAEPSDGRVYATAAELYCSLGRLEAAQDEIHRGLEVAGGSAAMERAQGVYFLELPGGAPNARAHLERALELEPDLAFAARPLARADLLVGRDALRHRSPLDAVRAARAGLELYPDDVELRRLHADALLAAGSLRHAVELFEGLLADGEPVEDDLALAAWRAGMGELVQAHRSEALSLFARARELGMPDDALGTAADLLAQESAACVGRGVKAYEAGNLEEARDDFAEAVHLDPGNLAAENHLAVTHARLGMTDLAIDGWTRVLTAFDEKGGRPPEPVHLNLARVLLERGETGRVKGLLEHYEPERSAELGPSPTAEELSALVEELAAERASAALKRAE